MLLDVLGIVEDFSQAYGVCQGLVEAISMQPDLPQHYAVHFCPTCFATNYVDANFAHNVVACWHCQYEGFVPGVSDEDCHHSGCDCDHCQACYVTGLSQLPTKAECGCSTCDPIEPQPLGSVWAVPANGWI